jgi:L-ascorbate metabolism protein UlaG (beta-lactamase superfamily)
MSRWIFSLLAALLLVPSATLAAETPPAWVHSADANRPVGPDELAVRWLGTAAFEIRTVKACVLIDPHFSRHNLWQLLAGPLHPDLARIRKHLPRAQAVFIGHSHHDHLVDAPTVAKLLDAPIYGSADTARVAREEGVPLAHVHALQGGETIRVGDLAIEAVPSAHSDIITNWLVAGRIAPESHPPMRFTQYKHGPVFTYVVHWRGRTVYHFGSAELVEANLRHRQADVALVCLSGWKDNRSVFGRLASTLHPSVIVPMHHDDFFRDLDEGFHPGQLAYVDEAYEAIRHDMPDTAMVKLDFFQEIRLSPRPEETR